jgi:hypothetical protein
MRLEKKVLTVFGRAIRPANWTIFISGIVLIPLGIGTIWIKLPLEIIGAVLISLQGVDFLVSGYGEVKADEDVKPT